MVKNSTAVANGNGDGEMEIQGPSPVVRFLSRMSAMASVETEETAFTGDDIVGILEAATEEEVWDADERDLVNGQSLIDCEIGITGFEVKYSSGNDEMRTMFKAADGRGMYLLVNAVRLSDAGEKRDIILPKVGEPFVWNTSARFLVAKIVKFGQMGLIDPDNGKILECVVKGIAASSGTVLKLRPMPRRVVRG